jgi:hypothetical protein
MTKCLHRRYEQQPRPAPNARARAICGECVMQGYDPDSGCQVRCAFSPEYRQLRAAPFSHESGRKIRTGLGKTRNGSRTNGGCAPRHRAGPKTIWMAPNPPEEGRALRSERGQNMASGYRIRSPAGHAWKECHAGSVKEARIMYRPHLVNASKNNKRRRLRRRSAGQLHF